MLSYVIPFLTKYREFLLYGIIGCICSGLDFGIYSILCPFIPFLVANIISTHFGIICSFFLNRQYNFKVIDRTRKRLFSFYLIGLLGLTISEGLLHLMVSSLEVNEIFSKLITVIVVAIIQFVLNKIVTFKKVSYE